MSARAFFFFIIIFSTSMASMAFEILIARLVSEFSYNYIVAQSLTLSIFILGMGIGSYFFNFLKNKSFTTLIKIELYLFFTAFVSIYAVYAFHLFVAKADWTHNTKLVLLLSVPQLFVFLTALLAGTEIPFFAELVNSRKSGSSFGLILALSYVGSFAASLVTVSWLLPNFGIFNTFNCVLILILLSCYLLCLQTGKSENIFLVLILGCSLLTGLNFYFAGRLQQIYLQNYYYGQFSDQFPTIDHTSSPYQEIDVVPDLFTYNRSKEYYLYIDQKLQYAGRNEIVYHESMVHGAINLNSGEPQKILILGGGEGLIARELLKYDSVHSIDLIELDRSIIDLATTNELFVKQNKNSLSDARVSVHIDDAYMWLKNTRDTYDAIFIDLPHPFSVELSRLYSFEFYSFVAKRLSPDGFMIFDYPLNHLADGQLKYYPETSTGLIYDTLSQAGFNSHFSFGPKESFIFATRKTQKPAFDEEKLFKRVSNMTLSNLTEIEEPKKSGTHFNSVFRPYFLTE
ncbi:MAG: spermidine synthase [Pseudobdellovibrio sp.]